MRFYTIQPYKVWEILQKKGSFSCDQRKICSASFKEAYAWYVNQAKKRIPGWSSPRPVWLWVNKPDLRQERFILDSRAPERENYVLLELEIPEEKVLLSEFSLWHFVLNKVFLPYNNKEDRIFERKRKGKSFEELSKSNKKNIEKSWERCLVTSKKSLSKFSPDVLDSVTLQGIVENLKVENVVKVTPFIMINKFHSK